MWLEPVLRLLRRRPRWRLFRGQVVMECFITSLHPTGAKILFVYGGELYYEFVHAVREDAEREAEDKRHQLTCFGWSERCDLPKCQPH